MLKHRVDSKNSRMSEQSVWRIPPVRMAPHPSFMLPPSGRKDEEYGFQTDPWKKVKRTTSTMNSVRGPSSGNGLMRRRAPVNPPPPPPHYDVPDAKVNRSRSFLDTSGPAGVKKLLKKSASILYPSWLSAEKRKIRNTKPEDVADEEDDGWESYIQREELQCQSKMTEKVAQPQRSGYSGSGFMRKDWQSLVTLPEARGPQLPATGYASGNFNVAGSVPDARPEARSFYLLDDYLTDELSLPACGWKTQSFASLDATNQRVESCPSYESLDDYLITSDDEYRSRKRIRRKQIIQQPDADWYCDSFESLTVSERPDVNYSPPDISPDDSSDQSHAGMNRKSAARKPIVSSSGWQKLHCKVAPIAERISAQPPTKTVDSGSIRNPVPVYLHDWVPPPDGLVDCGCRKCHQISGHYVGPEAKPDAGSSSSSSSYIPMSSVKVSINYFQLGSIPPVSIHCRW